MSKNKKLRLGGLRTLSMAAALGGYNLLPIRKFKERELIFSEEEIKYIATLSIKEKRKVVKELKAKYLKERKHGRE